jgi:DnaJ-domain-containing protein 1
VDTTFHGVMPRKGDVIASPLPPLPVVEQPQPSNHSAQSVDPGALIFLFCIVVMISVVVKKRRNRRLQTQRQQAQEQARARQEAERAAAARRAQEQQREQERRRREQARRAEQEARERHQEQARARQEGPWGRQQRPWWDVLGVAPGAPMADVQSAYRQKLKQYHPDTLMASAPEIIELGELRTKELNQAFSEAKRRWQSA